MRKYADPETVQKLHKKYAPTEAAFKLVFTHCQIVWDLAQQFIASSHPNLDVEFVRTACMLHDIGVYLLYLPNGEVDHANYIKHGVLGHELLAAEGFDQSICRVASCHTGVGISAREIVAEKLPLPVADYNAITTEERLVMYADKFHTKTTPPKFMTANTYAAQLSRFGASKVLRFRELEKEFGLPSLPLLAEKYHRQIV